MTRLADAPCRAAALTTDGESLPVGCRLFLWPGAGAVVCLSVCAGVVFLAAWLPSVPVRRRAGREGVRKGGAGGDLRGEPRWLWRGVPPVVPPAEKVSRPLAVRFRGGWPGVFGWRDFRG